MIERATVSLLLESDAQYLVSWFGHADTILRLTYFNSISQPGDKVFCVSECESTKNFSRVFRQTATAGSERYLPHGMDNPRP